MPATKPLAVVEAAAELPNVGPAGVTVHNPVVPPGNALPVKEAVVAEHKF